MYLARGGGGVVDPPVGSAPPALRRDGESTSKGLIKVKVLGVSGSCRGPHLLWWVECPMHLLCGNNTGDFIHATACSFGLCPRVLR